ncbi:MAG: NADH-quinone oxidoreductase subunit I [Myxococcota bacterium]
MRIPYLTGAGRALWVTFRNFFRSRVTEGIRSEQSRAPRYKASFALVHDENGEEACIGCKLCEVICPSTIISVTPAGKRNSPVTGKKRGYCEDFTLDLQACIYCELCVQVCPTDAIVMLRVQEEPGYAREDLVLTMDKLYDNERKRPLYWAKGSLLLQMQDPTRSSLVTESPEEVE